MYFFAKGILENFQNSLEIVNFVSIENIVKSLIVIPTYNERETVELMAEAIISLNQGFTLLFVDDNSPDGTGGLIKGLEAQYPTKVFLLSRSGKLGLGTAYIEGFRWALARDFDYIFEMDCDFSHDPKDLIRLQHACASGVDMAIGSRYCRGGRIENWPFSRWLLSYFANLYVRMVLWIGIKDSTAGFKCYSRNALASLHLEGNKFKGYAFQICMKYAVLKHGLTYTEVPIVFKDRTLGVSKMSSGIFKEALFGVWKMRKMNL